LGTSWGMHLGTLWELENSLGTYPCPCPSQKKRKRNCMIHECMLSFLIASMKFLFPKLLVTIFGPWVMARAEIWGHSEKRMHLIPTPYLGRRGEGGEGEGVLPHSKYCRLKVRIPLCTWKYMQMWAIARPRSLGRAR
jgi:hypothetical protein